MHRTTTVTHNLHDEVFDITSVGTGSINYSRIMYNMPSNHDIIKYRAQRKVAFITHTHTHTQHQARVLARHISNERTIDISDESNVLLFLIMPQLIISINYIILDYVMSELNINAQ